MSHAIAKLAPAPAATPFTQHTTGLFIFVIAFVMGL